MSQEEALQHALGIAYSFLNRRERTVVEMRRRLERDGTEPDAIAPAIQTLVEQGYLDDVRYARLFVQDRRQLDQWGGERIRRILDERGIDPGLIDRALGADQASEAELQRALELLRRRFPEPPRDRRERDRALGAMLRKGYDSELALEALAAYARSAEAA